MALSTEQLLEIVVDPASVPDLATYFAPERVPGELPRYTGGRFEALAGGGDRAETAYRITADDLFAVQMLSVTVPRDVALDLLEGPLGREVARLLREISTDVALGTADAANELSPGGPADEAWRLLKAPDDVGWVVAGKLLARKRPRLIPVYDNVVRCAFGAPRGVWLWLNERFAEQDGVLPHTLEQARAEAGVPSTVHPARILDVIIWMRHHAAHVRSRCRRAGLPPLTVAVTGGAAQAEPTTRP